MRFLFHLPIAVLIFAIGIALTTNVHNPPDDNHYYYLMGAVGAQVWLAVAAIWLRSKRLPQFDMIVASEMIIALGILALICGIIIAVIFASQRVNISDGLNFQTLRPLLTPFAEGLFAAGFAPVLATLLRQIEVLKYGSEIGNDDSPEAAVEAELYGLMSGVLNTTKRFDELALACERSQAMFERSATSLNKSTDAYEVAVARIEASLSNLSAAIKTQGDGFTTTLGTINAHLNDHEKQLTRSIQEMNELAEALRRFKTAADEGTTLLNGLRSVMESVERFIHPDDR